MSISLRAAWANTVFARKEPRDDPARPKIATPVAGPKPWHDDTISNRPPAPPPPPSPLQPLSEGIRASSAIRGTAEKPHPLPTPSLRRLIRSLTSWTTHRTDYPVHTDVSDADEPYAKDLAAREVQGLAYGNGLVYIIQTYGIQAMKPVTWTDFDFSAEGTTQVQVISDRMYWRRRQIEEKDKGQSPGPKHLAGGNMYHAKLVIPAEGVVYPEGHRYYEGLPSGTYQWLWVFNPKTLGYVGRIALPANRPDPDEGLGNALTATHADEESGLLWACQYDQVRRVFLFRLPDISVFDAFMDRSFSGAAEDYLTAWMEGKVALQDQYPTVLAEYVGLLPLTDHDGTLHDLGRVGGVTISDAGHLYMSFNWVRTEAVEGIHGLDFLSGRVVTYISTDDVLGGAERAQGLATQGNALKLMVWQAWPDNDYSIQSFSPRDGEL